MPMWSPGTITGTHLGWVKNPRLRGPGHEDWPWRNRQCHLWVTPPHILKYQPHSDRKEIGIPYLSTEPWSFIPRARPRLSAKIIFYTGPEARLFWKHSRCSFKKKVWSFQVGKLQLVFWQCSDCGCGSVLQSLFVNAFTVFIDSYNNANEF